MAKKSKWSKEERRIKRIIVICRLYGMIYHAACGVFIRVFRPHIWQLAADIDTLLDNNDPSGYWSDFHGLYLLGLPRNRFGATLCFAVTIFHKDKLIDNSITKYIEVMEDERSVERARQIKKRLHDCYGLWPEGTL